MEAIKEKVTGWETEGIPALEVKQLLMGLEMGGADEALLQYLDFLSEIIPVNAGFFLHVVPEFDLLTPMFRKEVMPLSGVNILKETLVNRMGGEISRLLTNGRIKSVKYKVDEGSPLEELLIEAEALTPDLVVIGQKRFANSHGILAKNLARKVTSNALVVPEQARRSLRTILVPVDFSAYSARALKAAVAINKRLAEPARILALNVYEMPNVSAYMMSKTETEFRRMVEEDRMAAFDAFIATHLSEGEENVEQQLVEKDRPGIAHYVMDYAKEQDVDFIVMGARGHSKVELLLLGSVTESVLAGNKHIPTLVVK
ncbi:universal stress protein [Lewinella cohaerens]|uniref:universal stress protein n=1 Tax=Lewinella cohaerens TaxID=70995 RepID=UPI00037A26E6|nr:universal stress protein [Lewinella cohaerens]